MRFKKLELLGFKSFADSTEITFDPGVTAIVGPNGGGKSNLADAIKWVLGEQSARELRGGRMEDLIFNGSDRREPISYAEVALTLDNSDHHFPIDFSEITISRRLFRSGESEYLLNKSPVRLKDITELLMGTGIGTSAYSLFEQGKIEQIISAHPEDRRVIFEEAAGITKFKAQKKEAMRRLDETEENLVRLSDVIAEVKRQIQSLERQVRRAKAYQENHEQLKRLEMSVALHEETGIIARWQAKEDGLAAGRDQVKALEQKLLQQEGGLNEVREAVSLADGKLNQSRETLFKVTHRQETARTSLQNHQERLQEAKEREAQVRQELEAAQHQVAQIEKQQLELSTLIEQESQERQAKEEKVNTHQTRLDQCARLIGQAQETIGQAKGKLLSATAQQVQVKNSVSKLHQEWSRLEARDIRLQMEKNKVTAEWNEASTQVAALEQEVAQAQTAVDALEEERRTHNDQLVAARQALEITQKAVYDLEQEVTRVGSQLELLKNLLTTHEGYSNGVKALLTAFDQERLSREGVAGVLAELIQVKQEDVAAVDAALGPWAEAIVVESGQALAPCRTFLEENKAGRVLFLIRDRAVGSDPKGSDPGGSDPTVVPILERIGMTPHLGPLLRLLLGETWLVPDRLTAEKILGTVPEGSATERGGSANLCGGDCPSIRLVTPSGELFTPAGALVGSLPSEEGLVVGRMSRLQSLEMVSSRTETRLEEARGNLEILLKQHQVLESEGGLLEANLQEKTDLLSKAKTTVESATAALTKLEQEKALLETEEAEVSVELSELTAQIQAGEGELGKKDEVLRGLEAAIEEAQSQIAQNAQVREETAILLATAKTELASFDEIAQSRKNSLRLLTTTGESALVQVTARQEELTRLETLQSQWAGALSELEVTLDALTRGLSQAETEVTTAQAQREQILEEAKVQEKEWQGMSRRLEQLQSQLHTQEMEQAQLAFQKEQIRSRMSQVYQVNLEERPVDLPGISSEEDLTRFQEEINTLTEKLQRMGPVNLGSIDEERELQERYTHLTTQQNDLLQAKSDLHEALTKINRTTRAMFRETFEAIQREFQATFKQLFQGGEARLILMDEEDVLESGVEIIARPPGKPLQAISLLSGGEKALTSIALLFAIFRVKPSPFCLLDEIDAPLDEANVDRFTHGLKEFLKESQFIIITHNKKTMGMADVLYGITMEEYGVSKVVSVKFREDVPVS